MKRNIVLFALSIAMALPAYASMVGACNNNSALYICCPALGGWIVNADCNPGASTICTNDTGLVAHSNPPISILDDCKKRGGSAITYYYK